MAEEEKQPDMTELLRSKSELEKRLDESQKTIDDLEHQLSDISRALADVMKFAKTAFPEAYEEFMKKQNTEEEN